METQKCVVCGEVKPITEFHKNKSRKSGIHNDCKECANRWFREHDKKQKEEKKGEVKIMETKMCFKCKEVKAITEFSKCSDSIDGLYSYCKMCQKSYYALRYALNVRGKTPETMADLETFINRENILITAEEKRTMGRERRTAARKIIVTKAENKLLKMREVAIKQAEKIKAIPLFIVEKKDTPNDTGVAWDDEGAFDTRDEIKNGIFQLFKKSSADRKYHTLTSYKGITGEELSKILEEFVRTHLLEKAVEEGTNRIGYRFNTKGISLNENNSMIVNPER